MTVTIRAFTFADDVETAWDVECEVSFGRRGTYHAPPEPDDVEFVSATAGAVKLDGDDFFETYGAQLNRDAMEEEAIEAAGEAVYDAMADRADFERDRARDEGS